ncbi:MAG: hypothetical protein KAH77_09765 [Thiomargarita sp.]|nr:hypothetical protein [Thiomargarita sp.]
MIIHHESSEFLKKRQFLPIKTCQKFVLSEDDALDLRKALDKDSEAYLYNGILSVGAGIKSLLNKNYGWATVQFYYSVFYLARAHLASDNIGIVYDGSKPYIILSQSGEQLIKKNGTTHKLVLKQFKEHFSNHLMLNTINGQCPLMWLMDQRELMNYRSAVMPDPTIPLQYQEIIVSRKTIRQWLHLYLLDDIEIYSFDLEHACLAYPFKFLIHTIKMFKNKNIPCRYVTQNQSFIKKLFSDKSGCFDFILEYLKL